MVVRDGRSAARGQAVRWTGLRGWRGGGGCAWAAAGARGGGAGGECVSRQSRSERYITSTSGGAAPARCVLVLCHSGGPGRFRDFVRPD